MISNYEVIPHVYVCNNKRVKDYLIFKLGFPLLSVSKDGYIFAYTEKLEEALENLPFWLRVLKNF